MEKINLKIIFWFIEQFDNKTISIFKNWMFYFKQKK